jgi:hypothetical protein
LLGSVLEAQTRRLSAVAQTSGRPALRSQETLPEAPSSKRGSQSGQVATRDDGSATAILRGPVLIVAQDRFASTSLARALIRESFSVRSATDAAELVTATSSGAPCALVLSERTTIDMPRPLASLLRACPETPVIVHGCARATLAEAMLRAIGATRVIGIEGAAAVDIVSALRVFFPE